MVLGRVHVRDDDLALLTTRARDAHDPVAGTAVAGHHAAGGDGLVVGMSVDGQQGVLFGHVPIVPGHVQFTPTPRPGSVRRYLGATRGVPAQPGADLRRRAG